VLGLVGGGSIIAAVAALCRRHRLAAPWRSHQRHRQRSARSNLVGHARGGKVKWPCAQFRRPDACWRIEPRVLVPGDRLLALFGGLMIVIGIVMALRKDAEGNPDVRLSFSTARELLPLLLAVGFGVGALAGFFGIGGGFLIVPGLMLATGMPIANAIATSLVAVTAFGATTAGNYALSGLVDWRIAGLFVAGGIVGGIAGTWAGKMLADRKGSLATIFAGFVILIGIYVTWKGLAPLLF
jgi:hypothetical protein